MTTPYQARRLLDAWIGVGPPLDERPTRPEVKDWVRVGLNDRCRLRAENEALTAQRDAALEELAETGRLRFEVEGLEQTVAHVCRARDEALEECVEWRRRFDAVEHELDTIQAQRDDAREELAERRATSVALGSALQVSDALDRCRAELAAARAQQAEALEGYREDVEHFRAHVQTLDEDRTRRTRERDTAERNLHERTVEMTKRYEELRAAYDQAEAECNEYARELHRSPEEMEAAHRLAYKKHRGGKSFRDIAGEMAGAPHFCGGPATARRWVTEGRRLVRRDEDGTAVEGRVECEHGVGVNFTTLRLSIPEGGAE